MHSERVVSTIDAHAAGEPLRVITSGVPPLAGDTILDRRRDMALACSIMSLVVAGTASLVPSTATAQGTAPR